MASVSDQFGFRALLLPTARIIKAEWIRVVGVNRAANVQKNFRMGSITQPFAASGPRSPIERPRRIPQAVQAAVLLMIHEGTDFVTAAQANGLRPDTMRRWLHRPELVSLIRRERAAFRQAICSGNEHALAAIRDEPAGNAMAKVNAIRTLEALGEEAALRSSEAPSPGIVLRVVTVVQNAKPAGQAIEANVIAACE